MQRIMLSQLGEVSAELLRQIAKGALVASKHHCLAVARGSKVQITAVVVPDGAAKLTQTTETNPGRPGDVTIETTEAGYTVSESTPQRTITGWTTQQETGTTRTNATAFYEEGDSGSGTKGIQSGVA